METINEALEARKPALIEAYKANVERIFRLMVADLGPGLRGVHGSWAWAKTYGSLVAGVVKVTEKAPHTGMPTKYEINPERLQIKAAVWAGTIIGTWKHKIMEKVGSLDTATVEALGSTDFIISGTKAGHKVVIEQNMIMNHSSAGTLFNQFPARIYVDGKFCSAAGFKKIGL